MYILKFACLSYHSFRSFYMADGGKRCGTCFGSSERKAMSIQQSSPRLSYGPLRKTNLFQASLQQEVSHRFMLTNRTHCHIVGCMALGYISAQTI